VDPLDGTTNYAHGYPCFCVTLALEHDGEIVIGVTFDPTRDELFAAEKNQGASLNRRKIRVSTTESLGDSLIVTGFPYDFKDKNDFGRHLTDFLLQSRGIRRDGSAAIDLAYVACGRFDGFWEEGLHPWDLAAGKLLIEEAGGEITNYDGSPYSIYNRPPVCASNGRIHKQMLNILH
ncbi:MAG: inositol monophosphatase, partial [Acidobacteria bacterium]|nr:inositol monophosphatase [Acidobacteriota bacterium]